MTVSKYYEILGISYNASPEEIKKAYKEIALSCHPDKLIKMSDGEIKQQKIEKFKEATIAYDILTNKRKFYNESHDKTEYDDINWNDISVWKDMWFSLFSNSADTTDIIRDTFLDIANTFIKSKIYSPKEEEKINHYINVEVSYKEILQNTKKKLRLILVDIDNPIFVDILCGNYPKIIKEYTDDDDNVHEIHISMLIKKQENFDYVYHEKSGKLDIITTIELNLLEYINGCSKDILYIDDTNISISIPPFQNEFLEIIGKGVKKGSFVVNISVKNISSNEWNILNENEKFNMVRYLHNIYGI